MALTALCAVGPAQAQDAATPVTGLDHMPLAVSDLDRASADFERLGFTIKPGRPHDNGIRNANIKFPNTSAIELITASDPTDALAQAYVERLAVHGEGGAWWGLYSPDFAALDRALGGMGLDPESAGEMYESLIDAPAHRMFIGGRGVSPTDGPQYWTHPNTAWRWAAVWIAEAREDAQLMRGLGVPSAVRRTCAPFEDTAEVFTLAEGDEVIVTPAIPGRAPERAILGATILVRNLDAARRVLDGNEIPYEPGAGCGMRSVWIDPADAHGLWLELRQQ